MAFSLQRLNKLTYSRLSSIFLPFHLNVSGKIERQHENGGCEIDHTEVDDENIERCPQLAIRRKSQYCEQIAYSSNDNRIDSDTDTEISNKQE